jgi:RHS repeat-associated protein
MPWGSGCRSRRLRFSETISGSSTYYYYDGFGSLAMTKSGSGQTIEEFIPGAGPAPDGARAGAKYYWTGSAWETHYLHGNQLGSTQIVTRADNTYEEARNFYPFGGLRWQGGGSADVRFASMKERDSETSGWQDALDWTPNRLYSEGFGRWFSPDSLSGDITNPQSLNRYAYVMNNPTTLTDPLGLVCKKGEDCPPDDGGGSPIWDEGACTELTVDGVYLGNTCAGQPGHKGRDHGEGGSIVVTNPSQTGTKQTTIGNVLSRLASALACDPECTSFLAQNGLDPMAVLSNIQNGNFGHADISENGDPNSIAAVSPVSASINGVADTSIFVNNQGAFFQGSAGGASMTIGPKHLPGGTPAAQAFILLHELGHNTKVLRPDAEVPKSGRQNDKDIQSHCKKTIESFK